MVLNIFILVNQVHVRQLFYNYSSKRQVTGSDGLFTKMNPPLLTRCLVNNKLSLLL